MNNASTNSKTFAHEARLRKQKLSRRKAKTFARKQRQSNSGYKRPSYRK